MFEIGPIRPDRFSVLVWSIREIYNASNPILVVAVQAHSVPGVPGTLLT